MTGFVDRIVFSGDFLRPSVAELRPTQHENIQWLYQLLQLPVQMATGLPCDIVHWDNRWINQPHFDQGTIEAIYQAFWLPPDIRSWPHLFAADTLPGAVEDLFLRAFENSFVIGFELPPYLVHFLNRHGIGFVDCSLSPIRFMDDLLFEVSSSNPALTDALRPHAVPEDLVRLQAGVLSANAAKANPNPPQPNSLLLILQTVYDKVVIENGRFVTVLDYIDRLSELAKGYDHVLIKQHPLERQEEVLKRLTGLLPGSQPTEDNFYRLVSHPNLKGVAALSSSCIKEAAYFGKEGHYLMPSFNHRSASVGLEAFHIGDAVIAPDFWRDLFSAAQLKVSRKDGLSLPSKPNRFRKQLRSAWGYNQLDTDIAVSWAPQPPCSCASSSKANT